MQYEKERKSQSNLEEEAMCGVSTLSLSQIGLAIRILISQEN